MSLTADMYGYRSNGEAHGDVFTSPQIVTFMLDLAGYTPDKDLSGITILEPSCGEGEFLVEIQHRLVISAKRYNFDPVTIFKKNVFACDLDKDKVSRSLIRLQSNMPQASYFPNIKCGDFLLSDWKIDFDIIIGNPPYIRYENIPEVKRNIYKGKFVSFHYRCDIYTLFYEHSLQYLKSGGIHCFICSNRWLKNKSGEKLREFISSNFKLRYLVDIENLKAFESKVLAYPAITVIENQQNDFSVEIAIPDNISELNKRLTFNKKQYASHSNWDPIFTSDSLHTLPTIEEAGFVIGIGVATGADSVFISNKWKDIVESDVLLPLINSRDLSGDSLAWDNRFLLNPYDKNGNLIDLEKYPKTKTYLEAMRQKLEKRHIVKKNRTWYSLIDRIKPDLLNMPKILLPELSANRVIFIDEGRFYPAHNIYYITGQDLKSLRLLAATLMSSFIREQMSQISTKMNGGFSRWQSQTIKKLHIPNLQNISSAVASKIERAFLKNDIETIDFHITTLVNKQIAEKIKRQKKETAIPSLWSFALTS